MGTINDGTIMWETRDRRLTEQQNAIVDLIYPVGSIITTVSDTAPIPFGTWKEVGQGRVLQGGTDGQIAGKTIEAGLPNIIGRVYSFTAGGAGQSSGALIQSWIESKNAPGGSPGNNWASISMDASKSNSIYGGSKTVQPPAYLVHFWQRIA